MQLENVNGMSGTEDTEVQTNTENQEPETGATDNENGANDAGEEQDSGEKAWKTAQNAEAAQRRRMAEAAQRNRIFREVTAGLVDPTTGQPFADEDAFARFKQGAAVRAQAQAAGVEPEAAQRLVDGVRDTIRETDPVYRQAVAERQAAAQRETEATFARDMAEIKKLYPDEKAKDVRELGDRFMAIMANSDLSAVEAYEVVRKEHARTNPKPPSTGAINTRSEKQGGYYTRDQVAAMSDAEIEKHYEEIRKSMQQW